MKKLVWLALVLGWPKVVGATLSPRILVKYKANLTNPRAPLGSFSRRKKKEIFEIKKEEKVSFLKQMREREDVEYVEEDILMQTQLTPNDTSYLTQWHYYDFQGGINLPRAWDETTGSQVVVAVVDTGVLLNHPDLNSKVLPGVDMISDSTMGNDGNGRDMDPSDPGDFVEAGDPCYQGIFQPSSWHGTHVAGTIGAESNNFQGGAGVNWNARILPIRVLGKCGGFSSDIADGIRWAAGGSISGVADNQNPAKVINLSLGGRGACPQFLQEAIDFANSQGTVVVVASGNEGVSLESNDLSPVNCKGVLRVGANNAFGSKAGYSNYASFLHISAPGGEGNSGILSTSNNGSYFPATHNYRQLIGTSMATPHVSGVVSLMLSVNNGLFPAQIIQIIKDTARPFSFGACSSGGCGAGIVDAAEAVRLAEITVPDPNFQLDDNVVVREPVNSARPYVHQNDDDGAIGCGSINSSAGPGSFGSVLLAMMFLLTKLLYTRVRSVKVLA